MVTAAVAQGNLPLSSCIFRRFFASFSNGQDLARCRFASRRQTPMDHPTVESDVETLIGQPIFTPSNYAVTFGGVTEGGIGHHYTLSFTTT
jgi:hypothetical protein